MRADSAPPPTLIGLSPPRPKISKNPIAPCHNSFFGGLLLFLLKYDLFEHSKPLTAYDGYALCWPNLSPLKTQKWLKTLLSPSPKVFWGSILFLCPYMSFLNLQNHLQHFRWQKCAIRAAFKLLEGPKNGQKPYSPLTQMFFVGYYCFMPLY